MEKYLPMCREYVQNKARFPWVIWNEIMIKKEMQQVRSVLFEHLFWKEIYSPNSMNLWLIGRSFICSQNVTILRNKLIYRIYRVSTLLINMYYEAASISTIHVYSCRCSKIINIYTLYLCTFFLYILKYYNLHTLASISHSNDSICLMTLL